MITEILKESIKIFVWFIVMLSISICMVFPLIMNMNDCPSWLGFVVFPISILAVGYMNVKNKTIKY